MPTLHAQDIADVVAATLPHLGRLHFQQIAQPLQSYEVMGSWLKKDKVQFESGAGIQRTLMSRLSNQAHHTGLTDTDDVDIPDLLDVIKVDWVHAQTKWAFIYQSDLLMNRGREMIVNVIQPRRIDALISMAETLEQAAWSLPAAGDKKNPWGIPYWIVASQTAGFEGGLPAGHSTIAGVSLDDATEFKNYTDGYTEVSKPDLIKKMRTAHRQIGWKNVVGSPDHAQGMYRNLRIYVNEETLSDFEDVGEAQNENLGRDLAPMGGGRNELRYIDDDIHFRKRPIIWVPFLDSPSFTAANNPVYMIDLATFYPVCLRGDFLRESKPGQSPFQHNVYRSWLDLTYQYLCIDRRRNAVVEKAP